MYKISVMGLGYIGLPTAITLASAGFEVTGFDISEKVVGDLSEGRVHIAEPGLLSAFNAARESGRLRFASSLEAADVFYVAVPTPFYREDGMAKCELKYVRSAGSLIARVIGEGNLVILESTVPPRTTDLLGKQISEQSGLSEGKFYIAHCPERIIPGNMLSELKNNDRIVGAQNEKAAQMAKSIYEKILDGGRVLVTDTVTAEMCKLTENTFRDINIAYANELSMLCDSMGVDVYRLIELANCHPRVNILKPGVGVGGHCIAVDPWFIYEQFPKTASLIHAARLRNEEKPVWVAKKVDRMLEGDKKAVVGVLGLSYKADVDDLRESPSVVLCHELRAMGYRVIACEPFSKEESVEEIPNVSLEEILGESDFVVITLAHTPFVKAAGDISKKPCYDCVGMLR